MARIEIEVPEEFAFSTDILIRLGDINRGNHLSHVAMLGILEEARAQFLTSRGYADLNTNKGPMGYLITDVAIVYKKQAYYGQSLRVEIAPSDFDDKSFDFLYYVSEKESRKEVARAKTGQLLFDYQSQKVIPVPDELKNRLIQRAFRPSENC